MNKPLSIRQAVFMYLIISISPVLRQIPSALAKEAGRSGYISPIWATFPVLILTAAIVLLINSYPGLNIYEITVQLAGKVFAKVVMFLYLIWAVLYLTGKLNAYALTLQFTLMPKTGSDFFIQVMLLLVIYALFKTAKTIFRFSEFTLGPIFAFIGILFICAINRLRTDYLLPVSAINLPGTIKASKNVIAVGGNIILTMFFADRFGISITKKHMRKFWTGGLGFVLLTFVITIFTFGITGAPLTANLPFPFYITVKSITFFNIFERFEVLVTLVCILSDYVSICIMFIVVLHIIRWLFGIEEKEFLIVPVAMIIYYLTYFVSQTQFEYDLFYKHIIINLNLIFQYIIPFLLCLLCLLKRKNIRKQY
ncbi:MAG TPA: GerAB/ArcD/ProY family transporter [Mobilitalea sp.]|nr:GerAB/ArcD/ProY family transporter [Mobilitalea sp.]